jgi:hypothetical protein
MSSNRLYLHCGAHDIAFDDLSCICPPEPTDSWHPIPHSSFVTAIRSALTLMGATLRTESLAIKPGKTGADKFFGLIEFEHPLIPLPNHDGLVGFGFRSSWDKSFAQSGTMSLRTFVCDNLAMSGGDAISFHRKNTPGLASSYDSTIASCMVNFITQARTFVNETNAFDAVPLPDTREFIDTTACALADNGAILWQNVPHLRRELANPAGPGGLFPHRAAGLTKGLLLQAVTEVEKRSLNALTTPDRLRAAHSFITELEPAHA